MSSSQALHRPLAHQDVDVALVALQQHLHEVPADETGRAGHEVRHPLPFSSGQVGEPIPAAVGEDRCGYQPPCQSSSSFLAAALRRALRESSFHWSIDSASASSGKKAMTMKPALVVFLSETSP